MIGSFLHSAALTAEEVGIPNVKADSDTMTNVVNVILSIAGIIAVIILTVAGIKLIISQGEPQKVASYRNSIVYAAIGLVVIAAAGLVVNVIVKGL